MKIVLSLSRLWRWVFLACLMWSAALLGAEKTRDEKVFDDKSNVVSSGLWIYDDLSLALAEARRSGKPLLITLRCIP